jgi:hypothetical protein
VADGLQKIAGELFRFSETAVLDPNFSSTKITFGGQKQNQGRSGEGLSSNTSIAAFFSRPLSTQRRVWISSLVDERRGWRGNASRVRPSHARGAGTLSRRAKKFHVRPSLLGRE